MSVVAALSLSRRPAAAFAVLGMYWGAFAAYVPQIKAGLGAADDLFGLLLLGTATGLLTAMWLAPRVDRWLGAAAMPAASLCLAAAFLLPGLAPGPLAFCLSMVLVGICSGLTDVVMNARVSELESVHARPLMNANHGMFSAAYALSALAAGPAREAGVSPFGMVLALGLVTLALAPTMRMAVAAPPAPPPGTAPARLPWAIVGLTGLVVLLAFMTEAAVESWSALHVERTLGGNPAEGALGPAMLGLTMAVGRFSGQAVAERLSDLLVIRGGAALAATGALVAAFAPVPAVAYAGFGILGLGVSVIGPIGLALAGRLVPPAVRTDAISKAAVIGFSGFFLAPTMMGTISEAFGLRHAFAAVSLLMLAVFPLIPVLRRRGA